ncbi:MAG: alkene reductase [Burkholderiaceae bacterium]|nr:alkene reductase [Burkholderiaceae bacterium]
MTDPLFTPTEAGALALASRIVMAPLTRRRSPHGTPGALTASYYAQRANPETGAALIISEAATINAQAQGYANTPGMYERAQIEAWKTVTAAVHQRGGRIVCQLWHVGRVSHTLLQPAQAAPVAPSAIQAQTRIHLIDKRGAGRYAPASMPRALRLEEIGHIVRDFAAASRNAVESAGFDGVEIHAANGYLIEQFLKSSANTRHDDYGGSIANRARFLLEVARATCDAVGGARVGIRLSPVTPSGGIDEPDPQPLYEYVLRALAPLDLAYVHIVEGATGGPRERPERPFNYAALKTAYHAAGGHAAWMLNNGYDPDLARDAIRTGRADLVSFGRAFISMPDLAARIRQGGPYQGVDQSTIYGGGAKGYTDYPTLLDA